MADRIEPETVKEHLESPEHDTLLVCAYDSDEKFEQNHLEGAISLDEFRKREDQLPLDREIVFYCA